MTQFNLLPDIKLQYLKAQRQRKIVTLVSIVVSVVAILWTISFYTLTYLQKVEINSLANNIQSQGLNVSNDKNLNRILTIDNQISTLNTLHSQEPATSYLETYLYQLIPLKANISNLNVTFSSGDSNSSNNTSDTMTITGNANSLATINQLVDSLEFATYSVKGTAGSQKAFSGVVLSSFGIDQTGVSYTINFNFNPELFNITDTVKLNVPSKVSTRSELDQPTILFKPNPVNKKGGK